uniref:Uncharacterized protein n=1 Tax=Arundo donax TaxID=35708 RepID=A0A0A8ZDR7_ARUDO
MACCTLSFKTKQLHYRVLKLITTYITVVN